MFSILISWSILAAVVFIVLSVYFVKEVRAKSVIKVQYDQIVLKNMLSYLTQVALLSQTRIQNIVMESENALKVFLANNLNAGYQALTDGTGFETHEPTLSNEEIVTTLEKIREHSVRIAYTRLGFGLWFVQFAILLTLFVIGT